jgi:6-phosphogluconolactonase
MELRTFTTSDDLARAGAAHIAECAARAIEARGEFVMALSGGHSPLLTWRHLATLDLDWQRMTLFQVDERVAPAGHPDRNLTGLVEGLAPRQPRIVAMPVDQSDLDAAAAHYAEQLPDIFDLVHLGLGPDGHTASLVAGDAALETTNRLITVTDVYQGRRRMTMTYPALKRTRETLWIVSGPDVDGALERLLAGDTSIPAGRVQRHDAVVLTDVAGPHTGSGDAGSPQRYGGW